MVWLAGVALIGGALWHPFGAPSLLGALAGVFSLVCLTASILLVLARPANGAVQADKKRNAETDRARRALELAAREKDLKLRELEDELRVARQQTQSLHAVFQQLNHPAGFLEPDGTLIDLNAAAASMTGMPLQNLRGKRATELHAFGGADLFAPPLRRAARGETVTFQHHLTDTNGKRHTLTLTLKPVQGNDGGVELLILEGHDITERVQAEEALQETFFQFQQSQKMEAIGRLAGGIAHDFNNLLTSILGFSNMALEQLPPENDVSEDLQEVVLAATRAQNLTQKLLALSRKDVPDSHPLDLNRLLREMDNLIRVTLHENIEVVTEISDQRCTLLADPTSMEQVILNLAVNARDAMPRSGRLYIRTEIVEVDEITGTLPDLEPGTYNVLTMRDTGCGMEPGIIDHVFEPFFTTKESGQGTGLGLSMVYAIVKQYNGGIHLWSEPGIGTEMRLYFPFYEQVEQMMLDLPDDGNAPPLPRGTETVLLVEDEDGVRRMAAKMIESLGYTLLQASDGELGAQVAEQHDGKIDLIITDVVMPNLSGPEMIDRLRLSLGHIPHLYVSGFTMDKLKEHGADDSEQILIRKPYSREMIARRIRHALDSF